jgi:hypothetical protein
MDSGTQEMEEKFSLIVSTASIANLFISYLFITSFWGKVTDYSANINYRNIIRLLIFYVLSCCVFKVFMGLCSCNINFDDFALFSTVINNADYVWPSVCYQVPSVLDIVTIKPSHR